MFKLEIETENAAFEDSGEVPRILRELASRLESHAYMTRGEGGGVGVVADLNGNTVGHWTLET